VPFIRNIFSSRYSIFEPFCKFITCTRLLFIYRFFITALGSLNTVSTGCKRIYSCTQNIKRIQLGKKPETTKPSSNDYYPLALSALIAAIASFLIAAISAVVATYPVWSINEARCLKNWGLSCCSGFKGNVQNVSVLLKTSPSILPYNHWKIGE
jgi:hypothetical protein